MTLRTVLKISKNREILPMQGGLAHSDVGRRSMVGREDYGESSRRLI